MRTYIITSPRTGGVVLSEILAASLGLRNLEEYLNENTYFTRYNNNYWYPNLCDQDIIFNYVPRINDINYTVETKRRIDLLKSTQKEFVIHVQAAPMHSLAEAFLLANPSKLVFLERENIWNQVLSWGIAKHNSSFRLGDSYAAPYYYSKTEVPNLKNGSIYFDITLIHQLCIRIKKYYEFKSQITDPVVISYENALENLDEQLLKDTLQLDKISLSDISKKIITPPKEPLFKNLDQMKNIFNGYFPNHTFF